MSNKKIKVLFRHRSMEMGGVEKVLLSLLNNLDRDKFDLTLLLSLNQGELRNEVPPHVRKVCLVEGKEDLSKNSVLQKLQLFSRKRKLKKLLDNPEYIDKNILKESYDVEIGMTYNDYNSVLNSSNKKSKKIGWFHSEISARGFEPLVPMILDTFPKLDHIVYCSERIYELMHQHHPSLKYPAESVITNAIPIKEIKGKSAQKIVDFPASPVFASVGRLHFRKGYHKLIEAHAKLKAEGYHHTVLIVGDGEDREKLQQLIKDYGVEETFLLVGNKMNPYPYVKQADFFVLSSESEAWPLVIAEALILQKPVIATNTGDVSKIIRHGETGYIINYDPDEMYAAMKKFLTDKELCARISENLKTIEQQFDNRKIYDAVEKIIINLAKK